MSPSGPIFSPFRKGGYRVIWADKVCADRYLDWCIFPCRQHPATCNTANAEPLRVLCRNPPSPPFTKGGVSLLWLMTYSIQPSKPCQFFSPLPQIGRASCRELVYSSSAGDRAID